MKIIVIILGGLVLAACSADEVVWSLEDYFLSINYVQEQKNSSNIEPLLKEEVLSEWGSLAYPGRCEWFDLERIVDGDTLIVDDGSDRIRVRMIGIDTPESKKEGTAIETYALEASEALKSRLEGETEVCLVEDREGDKYDTYGRKLAYVFTAKGADLNALMIQDGWARAYTGFPMERKKEFEALEDEAQREKFGRWGS